MIEPTIDRRQAWCTLAVLIADGAPAPRDILFYDRDPNSEYSRAMIEIVLDDAAALWWWADRVGAKLEDPRSALTRERWSQYGSVEDWRGYYVTVKTYNASTISSPSGMDAVRAIAAPDITPAVGEVAGAHGDGAPATATAGKTDASFAPVWVAAERKGIDFHACPDASVRITSCGRSTAAGLMLTRAEAEEFASPCKRCYPAPDGRGAGLT